MRATLYSPQQAHPLWCALWNQVKAALMAGHRLTVTVEQEKRSNEQNRRLWALLGDVSKQVNWYGRSLSPECWKHIFSAAMKKQDVVPSLDGKGFVVLGISTSKMTVAEMSELQTLIEAFGAERSVVWTEPVSHQPPQALATTH